VKNGVAVSIDAPHHWTGKINHRWQDDDHTAGAANITFEEDGNIRTLRSIEAGEELFVDYRVGYWVNFHFKVDHDHISSKDRVASERFCHIVYPNDKNKLSPGEFLLNRFFWSGRMSEIEVRDKCMLKTLTVAM